MPTRLYSLEIVGLNCTVAGIDKAQGEPMEISHASANTILGWASTRLDRLLQHVPFFVRSVRAPQVFSDRFRGRLPNVLRWGT